jgi:hypothetical protein
MSSIDWYSLQSIFMYYRIILSKLLKLTDSDPITSFWLSARPQSRTLQSHQVYSSNFSKNRTHSTCFLCIRLLCIEGRSFNWCETCQFKCSSDRFQLYWCKNFELRIIYQTTQPTCETKSLVYVPRLGHSNYLLVATYNMTVLNSNIQDFSFTVIKFGSPYEKSIKLSTLAILTSCWP